MCNFFSFGCYRALARMLIFGCSIGLTMLDLSCKLLSRSRLGMSSCEASSDRLMMLALARISLSFAPWRDRSGRSSDCFEVFFFTMLESSGFLSSILEARSPRALGKLRSCVGMAG